MPGDAVEPGKERKVQRTDEHGGAQEAIAVREKRSDCAVSSRLGAGPKCAARQRQARARAREGHHARATGRRVTGRFPRSGVLQWSTICIMSAQA